MDNPITVSIFMSYVFYLLQFAIIFGVVGFALLLVGRALRVILFSFNSF